MDLNLERIIDSELSLTKFGSQLLDSFMKTKEPVLFDLDDTLVYPVNKDVVNYLRKNKTYKAKLNKIFGKHIFSFFSYEKRIEIWYKVNDAFGNVIDEFLQEIDVKDYLIPYADRFIESLKYNNIPVRIVSRNSENIVKKFAEYFDVEYSSVLDFDKYKEKINDKIFVGDKYIEKEYALNMINPKSLLVRRDNVNRIAKKRLNDKDVIYFGPDFSALFYYIRSLEFMKMQDKAYKELSKR